VGLEYKADGGWPVIVPAGGFHFQAMARFGAVAVVMDVAAGW
jgi:hypothetical protein